MNHRRRIICLSSLCMYVCMYSIQNATKCLCSNFLAYSIGTNEHSLSSSSCSSICINGDHGCGGSNSNNLYKIPYPLLQSSSSSSHILPQQKLLSLALFINDDISIQLSMLASIRPYIDFYYI